MPCLSLSIDEIQILAETFMIWSFLGVLLALFFYDVCCALASGVIRRFSSRKRPPQSS